VVLRIESLTAQNQAGLLVDDRNVRLDAINTNKRILSVPPPSPMFICARKLILADPYSIIPNQISELIGMISIKTI
jgi:hypothetical protein